MLIQEGLEVGREYRLFQEGLCGLSTRRALDRVPSEWVEVERMELGRHAETACKSLVTSDTIDTVSWAKESITCAFLHAKAGFILTAGFDAFDRVTTTYVCL
jgi:hypothetical protein